jgi:GDP-D-mannose dehydratase
VHGVVETVFAAVGLDWRDSVKMDPRFLRPEDPSRLVGNPAKEGKFSADVPPPISRRSSPR